MRLILVIILSLLWAASASAQTRVVSEAADETAVTIYPDDLALITEVRKVNVPEGRSVIAFEGVSDLIIPQSMVLREFTGVTLERNFDYDLVSEGSLFESAVGETVNLTRIDKISGKVIRQTAEIISASAFETFQNPQGYSAVRSGNGVVFKVDGNIEVFNCSGLSERVHFDGIPEKLNPAPVMSIEVDAETAGEQELVVSYLTSGLGWQADYRIDLQTDNTAELLAWLTLTNGTAKKYENVPLAIIAGDLNRSPDTRGVRVPRKILHAKCYPKGNTKAGVKVLERTENLLGGRLVQPPAPALISHWDGSVSFGEDEIIVTASKRVAVEEKLGDYKLYRIPDLVTVAPYQTKQIAFITNDDIGVEPYFEWKTDSSERPEHPTPLEAVYEVDNGYDSTLAKSLPKGTFRVFTKPDSDQVFFIGEDSINNLAVDEPVEIKTGGAFNVQIQTRWDEESLSRHKEKVSVKHRISNATDASVRVKIVSYDERMRPLDKIKNESHPLEAHELIPTWWIDVPANSAEILSYDFVYED